MTKVAKSLYHDCIDKQQQQQQQQTKTKKKKKKKKKPTFQADSSLSLLCIVSNFKASLQEMCICLEMWLILGIPRS